MRLSSPLGWALFIIFLNVIALILSVGHAVIASPTVQVTPTPTVAQWTVQPPVSPGALRACPDPGQWLLLYWGGANGVPIAMAADTCTNADLYWVNRDGRWMGFAKAARGASDTWDVLHGEAHFVHSP